MRLWRFSNVFNQADHVEREAIGRNLCVQCPAQVRENCLHLPNRVSS